MRLIDADALTLLAYKSGDYGHPAVVDLEDIADVPTIDAEPVVRCKDCKYYKEAPEYAKPEIGTKICRSPELAWDTECGDLWMWMYPDDFCSCGERREADGNV